MNLCNRSPWHVLSLAAAFATLALALPAHADNYAWVDWTTVNIGTGTAATGSASGTLASTLYGTINVTYSGQTSGKASGVLWTPVSSFSGGIVSNAPPNSSGIALEGGYPDTETITFSEPVVNPVFDIWSLGASGTPAYFNFTASEPFNLLAGGPSTQYGGQSIVLAGTAIDGSEGNGLVQFIGTYSTLTFTTPNYEGYYAFTVGEDATLTDNPTTVTTSAVPEPTSLLLLGSGLLSLPMLRRFVRR